MSFAVRVSYLGLIRNLLGKREEGVTVPPGAVVRDLLAQLADRHGDPFRKSLFKHTGELRALVQVCVDDRDIDELRGLDTPLERGERVSVVVGVYPPEGG
jgi:molybdopterin converting factor small subunit